MNYKCPLCLKELNHSEKLVRYCLACSQRDEISGSPESIRTHLKCRKNKCRAKSGIAEGVFFAHLDCEKQNPFWDGTSLRIPDNLTIDGSAITVPFDSEPRGFKHWQIPLLKKTLNLNRREMWFPGILLRATGETAINGKRFGQIVGLAGVRDSGKTILALQTLDNEGYFLPGANKRIEIEDFVYSQLKSGETIQPIFELLRLRSLMRANLEFPKPSPTLRYSPNLYTVFFAPTAKALQKRIETAKVNSTAGEIEKAKTNGSFSDYIQRAEQTWEKAKWLWEGLKWLQKIIDFVFGGNSNSGVATKPFMFTLGLYDVAGEEFANEAELIRHISQNVDRIALVIDATDFYKTTANREKNVNKDAGDNLDGLRYLKNELDGKPFCIVLTKSDLFFQHLRANYADLDFDENALFEGGHEAIRALLRKWADKVPHLRLPQQLNLQRLLNELISLDKNNPIFTVATKNLPADASDGNAVKPVSRIGAAAASLASVATPMITAQPVSVGIDTFVAWCLEIDKDEFIESV